MAAQGVNAYRDSKLHENKYCATFKSNSAAGHPSPDPRPPASGESDYLYRILVPVSMIGVPSRRLSCVARRGDPSGISVKHEGCDKH